MISLLRMFVNVSEGTGAYLKRRLLGLLFSSLVAFFLVELILTSLIVGLAWHAFGMGPSLNAAGAIAGVMTPVAGLTASGVAAVILARLIVGLPTEIARNILKSQQQGSSLLGKPERRSRKQVQSVNKDHVSLLPEQSQAATDEPDERGGTLRIA